jgi:hypothetical protein
MKPNSQFERGRFLKWSALFLVLVVAVFGFVQAVHVHDGLATDDNPTSASTHCLICVASHSAPVVTTVSFAPALAHTATVTSVADPQLSSRLSIPSAFIRPPPQAL